MRMGYLPKPLPGDYHAQGGRVLDLTDWCKCCHSDVEEVYDEHL